MTATCDCCRLLDGDMRPKPVEWCDYCQAWLCRFCQLSPARRLRAAAARWYAGRVAS